MNFYNKTKSEVISFFNSETHGLSSNEAQKRLSQNGKNRLKESPKESNIKRFFKQLIEPMTIILIIAAAISAAMEIYEGISSGHFGFPADVVIILAVVLINAILGVLQESKAEKAIEALQEIAAATSKVMRDGRQITIKSEELVVGDIIILEAGDAVPADARLIECASIKAEEAALTGESVPVNKTDEAIPHDDVSLGDRKNMIYMGSVIVYGRGKAIVIGTGMNTEMGKIADALASAEEGKTPLEIKLEQLSKILTKLVLGVCVVIFGYNIAMYFLNGSQGAFYEVALDSFITAIV